jgi:hypothetical protein
MRSGFKLGTFLSLCITAAMASCGSDEPASATTCGNQIREADELCDGPDLGGQRCDTVVSPSSQGTLACAANCIFVTTGCSGGGQGGQGGTGPTP